MFDLSPIDILEQYGFDIFSVHEEKEIKAICEIKDEKTGLFLFRRNTFDTSRIDFRCQAMWDSKLTGKVEQCKCEAVNLGGKCKTYHGGKAAGRPHKGGLKKGGFFGGRMSTEDKKAMIFLRDDMTLEEKCEEMLNLNMLLIKRFEDQAQNYVESDSKTVIKAINDLAEKGDISKRGAETIIKSLKTPPHKAVSDYLKNAKMFLDTAREFNKLQLAKAKCQIFFEFISHVLELHASTNLKDQQNVFRYIDLWKNELDRALLELYLNGKPELAKNDEYLLRFQPDPEEITNRKYNEEQNKDIKKVMPKNENKPVTLQLIEENGKWINKNISQ